MSCERCGKACTVAPWCTPCSDAIARKALDAVERAKRERLVALLDALGKRLPTGQELGELIEAAHKTLKPETAAARLIAILVRLGKGA